MKSSFDRITGSRLYKLGESIGNVVIISSLFLLFCLPLVTIGASCSALYFTVYKKYRKRRCGTLSSEFFRSFKDNLKNGIIIHLLYTVYSGIVGFNIYFALNGIGGIKLPSLYTLVAFIPVLPVLLSLPFVYPMLSRFRNGIKGTITNSFTLCMITFPKFVLIWLIQLIALAVSLCFPPAALVTPVAATYLIQMITEKTFAAAIRVEKAREQKAEEEAEALEQASQEEEDEEENGEQAEEDGTEPEQQDGENEDMINE